MVVCESMTTMLVGQVYGRWTVLAPDGRARPNRTHPESFCRCSCGVEKWVESYFLRTGRSTSCGCYRQEWATKRATTHGDSGTRLHKIWMGVRERCYSQGSSVYKYYGARGIVVDPQWDRFESFRSWAVENGYTKDLEIDRRDNDGPYSPENCRWVTRKVNTRNRSNTRFVVAWGERKSLGAWSEDPRCVVAYGTLKARLKRGWDSERAIGTL